MHVLSSLLQSLIKRPHLHRLRSSKSVSFSEDVAVEILVSPGKTKKGKPRPLVAKHKVERLKDNSGKTRRRRYHSDSEVSYNPSGGGDFFMEDFDEAFKKLEIAESKGKNKSRARHSSSESEGSSQDERTAAAAASNAAKDGGSCGGNSKKGSKKQRRKQKAKRDLQFGDDHDDDETAKTKNGEDGGESADTPTPVSSPAPSNDGPVISPTKKRGGRNAKSSRKNAANVAHQNGGGVVVNGDVTAKESATSKKEDVTKNGSEKMTEEELDQVPLELQNHTTQCEVKFQNDVMFELDD